MAQKKTASAKKKPTKKNNAKKAKAQIKQQPYVREYAGLICALFGFFGILRYFPIKDGWLIGALSQFDTRMVGWSSNLVPLMFIACAVILFCHHGRPVKMRIFSVIMLPVLIGALYHLFVCDKEYDVGFKMIADLWKDALEISCGGVISGSIAIIFKYIVSKVGAVIIFITASLFFVLTALNTTVFKIIEAYKNRERFEYEPEIPIKEDKDIVQKSIEAISSRRKRKKEEAFFAAKQDAVDEAHNKETSNNSNRISEYDLPVDDPVLPVKEYKKANVEDYFERTNTLFNKTPRVRTPDQVLTDPIHTKTDDIDNSDKIDKIETSLPTEESVEIEPKNPIEIIKKEKIAPVSVSKKIDLEESLKEYEQEIQEEDEKKQYHFPPITLLEANPAAYTSTTELDEDPYKDRLEMALRSFGINSGITNIVRGPSVTRYEIEIEVGVKLNKLTSLSDDIALSLGASGVRIAAIPNKMSTVGIEVPNKKVTKVYLREIIESKQFMEAKSKLTFAIGKDISGEPIIGDIAKLPHMLVAGTTGSGKSVCLNSLILSILYKAKPDEVKFIMVDPKMVEFKIYNGIPHLHTPVVTEAKKASGALQWAVVEMMKRYRLFSETGARELSSYNKIAESNDEIVKLPQIVVVIDELADLMMVAAKEVEDSIVRIAQMGRAAGIHLVIATQSPRAEIITGLMKANIPSRIALKVSSALESRIILDSGGNADKLVGNGDMLYVPVGTTKPVRLQGTWVSDEEREQIIDFIKSSADSETVYNEEAIQYMDKAAEEKSAGSKQKDEHRKDEQYDELLTKAIEVILDSNQASVSMLQRRLKLGYARAARLVDQMEEKGIVGPFEGSKPRQILITKQQWQEMQFIQGTAPIVQNAVQSTGTTIQKVESEPEQTMFAADDLFEESNKAEDDV